MTDNTMAKGPQESNERQYNGKRTTGQTMTDNLRKKDNTLAKGNERQYNGKRKTGQTKTDNIMVKGQQDKQ